MTIQSALKALERLLGDRLVTSDAVLAQHGENETYFTNTPPDAVIFPENTEDVSQIVKLCNMHACPIVAYGAGTSLEAQHLAVQGGVVLDFSNMNSVLEVRDEDLTAVVQPGLTREDLNTYLRDTGLFFSVDPGANASMGGMAATRASGTTAVRYGTMSDNVLAFEVVMADGTIIRTGTGARKTASGYDLTHLLIGSEGTLGIITELTVKLHGIPEAVSAATCRFDSVEDAVNTVILTIQSGIPMARIELLDDVMVRGFNTYSKSDLPEKPHLFVEFHGSPTAVAEQAENFGDIAGEFSAEDFAWTTKLEERTALWAMRHKAHYASWSLNPGKKFLATDVCVPISRLAEAVVKAKEDSVRLGLTSTIVGHVGDGNFHCGVGVDTDNPDEIARVEEFTDNLCKLALRLGGTVTGEHGIGVGKIKFMDAEHGAAVPFMRAVKAALDPNNILNPGKVIPTATDKR
ncbi:FAD-binding oxidoreductase [Pacificibacter marinus]|uniref:D-lactate dehydrogenase (cytochrome) n=1 Tax=Pacificibacter marinus TaxID=658057 RepID=A0A1Y5TNY9_9RHOB|nr:FAD-linked oxidase C-terminal domain-containing protein [Pacificibacter marinus]SEL33701.1 D-lactate dehydrogenase (cytochrome) [Pacificibacter marinus]SLN68426.1 putative FAD-linked oxidoreductase [Pacificibacter marinus]